MKTVRSSKKGVVAFWLRLFSVAILLAGLATPAYADTQSAALATGPAIFPLSVHPTNRYLVDSGGNPFRLNMESTWGMPSWASSADVDTYISSRTSKGFNTFIIMAPVPYLATLAGIPNQPATPPLTVAGLNPFTGAIGDFRNVYSEPYWAWIDTIVNKAAAAASLTHDSASQGPHAPAYGLLRSRLMTVSPTPET